MLGIADIGIALGENKISNATRKEKFNINDEFIEQKIGFQNLCTTKNGTTKLCLKAFEHLSSKRKIKDIECLLLVSQNQDVRIPHTSALLHKELGFSKDCLCFDIALGCSGYVIALANILSLMKSYNCKMAYFSLATHIAKSLMKMIKTQAYSLEMQQVQALSVKIVCILL